MKQVTFALIREGTSDDGLVAHIRTLILKFGATSALGAPREYKGTTEERIANVLKEDNVVDLIFVHRDADAQDPSPRKREIVAAATSLGVEDKVVPVIPVQELEAWLLADESAIREVAGRPKGKTPLHLPAPSRIEATKSPKEVLQEACLKATDATGRRRQRHERNLSRMRATLLERLEHDGPVTQLASWSAFVEAVASKTDELLKSGRADVPDGDRS